MRLPLVLALLVLLSGCFGAGDDDSGDGALQSGEDRPGYRDGVVVINEDFTVSSAQPARFEVPFGPGAREVILEIRQDSGVLPNLHVALSGCGELDPPASAGWQSYPLCDAASDEQAELTITVNAGAPAGSGSILVRADLPDAA
jgi:hypothetical protein